MPTHANQFVLRSSCHFALGTSLTRQESHLNTTALQVLKLVALRVPIYNHGIERPQTATGLSIPLIRLGSHRRMTAPLTLEPSFPIQPPTPSNQPPYSAETGVALTTDQRVIVDPQIGVALTADEPDPDDNEIGVALTTDEPDPDNVEIGVTLTADEPDRDDVEIGVARTTDERVPLGQEPVVFPPPGENDDAPAEPPVVAEASHSGESGGTSGHSPPRPPSIRPSRPQNVSSTTSDEIAGTSTGSEPQPPGSIDPLDIADALGIEILSRSLEMLGRSMESVEVLRRVESVEMLRRVESVEILRRVELPRHRIVILRRRIAILRHRGHNDDDDESGAGAD
ncbi:hypothetical protein F4778DRAFT_775793 [Xylariomycetidae sp. FL2044]|nr:hypothetical protein F4778DRAFT_775793 [Xylariomycetidae sp. FL2044]